MSEHRFRPIRLEVESVLPRLDEAGLCREMSEAIERVGGRVLTAPSAAVISEVGLVVSRWDIEARSCSFGRIGQFPSSSGVGVPPSST